MKYKFTKQHIENLRISHKGQKHSEKQDREKSIAFSGAGNPFYGKKHTEQSNKTLSDFDSMELRVSNLENLLNYLMPNL